MPKVELFISTEKLFLYRQSIDNFLYRQSIDTEGSSSLKEIWKDTTQFSKGIQFKKNATLSDHNKSCKKERHKLALKGLFT